MVSSIFYDGTGERRTFQVGFKILGEDYIRIYVDGIEIVDKTTYDIINNSIVFNKDNIPDIGEENVKIYVATNKAELGELGSPVTDITNVANSIDDVITVSENIEDVNTVANDIANVNAVGTNIDDVVTTATNIADINVTAEAIRGGGEVTGGQFTGGGLTKPLMYTSKLVTEDTTISSGINALAIDSYTIQDGVTLTIADGSVVKVV